MSRQATYTRWNELIARILRREIDWIETIRRGVSEVLNDLEPPAPVLFGDILADVFAGVLADPTLERLDEAEIGRLAAHVVVTCLHQCPTEHVVTDEGVEKNLRRTSLAVSQIHECFAGRSAEFKEGFIDELVTQYSEFFG